MTAPWLVGVASANGQESGTGTASVSVTPSDGLTAADLSVKVSGSGYSPNVTLSVGECTATLSACVSVVSTTTGPDGTFGPLDIALSTTVASTTCGTSGCSILAIDPVAGTFATHHLSFAPATPIRLFVTPDTGLTSATTDVAVAGTGFPAGAAVTVGECVSALTTCGSVVSATVDGSGAFGPVTVPVGTAVQGASCVPSGCTILASVAVPPGSPAVFATHPITFAPAPPAAIVTVDPATGLPSDGGPVSVSGSRFAPNSAIQVGQCVANASVCTTPVVTTARNDGTFGPLTLKAVPTVGTSSCVPTGCIVLVLGLDPATNGFVFVSAALGFVPPTSPEPTTTTVATTTTTRATTTTVKPTTTTTTTVKPCSKGDKDKGNDKGNKDKASKDKKAPCNDGGGNNNNNNGDHGDGNHNDGGGNG